MTIDEWISKFDNEECDKLSQMEQIEIKDMLIELKNSRNAISEICWAQANGMYCQDCVIRKHGVCPDKKSSLYGEWEKDWEDVEKSRRSKEELEKKNLRTACELLVDRVNLCKEWLRH